MSVLKLAVVEKDNRLAEEIRKNESLESTLRHVGLPLHVCMYVWMDVLTVVLS